MCCSTALNFCRSCSSQLTPVLSRQTCRAGAAPVGLLGGLRKAGAHAQHTGEDPPSPPSCFKLSFLVCRPPPTHQICCGAKQVDYELVVAGWGSGVEGIFWVTVKRAHMERRPKHVIATSLQFEPLPPEAVPADAAAQMQVVNPHQPTSTTADQDGLLSQHPIFHMTLLWYVRAALTVARRKRIRRRHVACEFVATTPVATRSHGSHKFRLCSQKRAVADGADEDGRRRRVGMMSCCECGKSLDPEEGFVDLPAGKLDARVLALRAAG